MRPTAWVLVPIVLLGGCSTSAPDCDDGDVEDLVFEISEGELAKQLYSGKGLWLPPGFTLDQVLQGDNTEAIKIAREVMTQASDTDMELYGIRTTDKNDSIMRVACAATLELNGNHLEITYEAQYTEDGMMHATVYGL